MKLFKNVIKIILAITLFCYLCYCVTYFTQHSLIENYQDCGIIRSKSTDEIAIKHGTHTELYLNIEFRKNGFRSMSVSPTTYFKHNRGESVCFDFQNRHSISHDIKWLVGLLTIIISIIILLVLFFKWLFN